MSYIKTIIVYSLHPYHSPYTVRAGIEIAPSKQAFGICFKLTAMGLVVKGVCLVHGKLWSDPQSGQAKDFIKLAFQQLSLPGA